jgi:hypothetical protein
MAGSDRSLEALGLAGVPALEPLTYPGSLVSEPGLLHDSEYLALRPTGDRVGGWKLDSDPAFSIDDYLAGIEQPLVGERHPVIAIGSNASPGQLRHKLTRLKLPVVVPISPLSVVGLNIGVSAHISPAGYVAISPYADPDTSCEIYITWLDSAQLEAVDASEFPQYRRILVSATDYPMDLPSGERVDVAYLYVNSIGVLADADGTPMVSRDQSALLSALLSRSAKLRSMFGTPQEWVERAHASAELRAEGLETFRAENWILRQDAFLEREAAQAEMDLVYGG